MLDFLPEGDYYEFPSFEVALFSILLSFILSSLVGFIYHFTNQGAFSRNFIQAMVLSSIVTCMVIMAVGDNVAAGFGIMGAIAIVRFRMRIENPRNIIFIFGALSIGIALGVYGYSIAIAGTTVFCFVALLLHYSAYGKKILDQEFNLYFLLLKEASEAEMKAFLDTRCTRFRVLSVANRNRGNRYDLFVSLKVKYTRQEFMQDLAEHESFQNVRLERSDNLTRL